MIIYPGGWEKQVFGGEKQGNCMTTILLTRPEHQVDSVKSELERLGAEVLLQPTIEIRPPDSWVAVDDAIRQLLIDDETVGFDWLVFSSGNGVEFFFNRVEQIRQESDFDPEKTGFGISEHHLGMMKPFRIAVVGSGTDEALKKRIGRRADVLPELFAAEGVLEQLLPEAREGKRFLLLRASRGRDVLKRMLQEAGGRVSEVVVYQSVDVSRAEPEIVELMDRGKIDWITATSSSIARSLVRLFGETLRKSRLVSISPITTGTLEELGFSPALEAKIASMNGLVEILAPEIRNPTDH